MLAISPLYNCGEREGELGNIPTATPDEYSDESFGGGPMLEDINFDDLFLGFVDGEVLPELEVDPDETFADFSFGSHEDDQPGGTTMAGEVSGGDDQEKVLLVSERREDEDKGLAEVSTVNSPMPEADRGRKPSAASQAKGSQGKRKVKVDWTPELHRKFVQAVEQLGVDKAVPSRILELMGIDCLTRHNIASHLQKYRSHRKHLLAREAEAASWRQRQQMYSSSGAAAASASGTKRDLSPWLAPTMGFPPPPPPIQPFRPLHVWGHPTMDHTLIHLWPKHLVPAWSPPPPPWALPPPNPSPWLPHYPRGPNALTQGMPCFPRPLPTMRFPAPTVPGCIPPHPLYRPDSAVTPKSKQLGSPLFDAHPSKESIDATIGDVLAKPCSPLPLGLKPPSLESVMMELQKKGISKIPPTS